MSFIKYSSLENHTNAKFLEKCFQEVAIQSGSITTQFVARKKSMDVLHTIRLF